MSTPPANRACALLLATAACVGPAGPPGEPGADGAAGPDGARSLTRLDPEPAGEACALGGARLSTGSDDDGDSQLDPDEVETVAYLCHGANDEAPRGVLHGTYHVRNQRDVELLDLVHEITGELVIERAVPEVIVLAGLQRLGGTLRVTAGSNLVALEVPALVEAGGIHIPDDTVMTRFRAPALTTAGAVSIALGTVELDLTALSTAAQLRVVAPLDDLQVLRSLVSVTGELFVWADRGLGPVTHRLRSCAGLERLETAGTMTIGVIAAEAPCALSSLAEVAGTMRVVAFQGSLSFPALVHAGEIDVNSGPGPLDVTLDALRSTDRLQIVGAGLRSLRAPVLLGSEVLVVSVGGNQLTEVALPSLRSVQDLFIRDSALVDLTGIAAMETVASDLFVRDNSRLVTASLPSLTAVRGSVLVYNNPALSTLAAPSLDAMGFAFVIRESPMLCASQAQAIIDHLRALGWTGTAETGGLRAGC